MFTHQRLRCYGMSREVARRVPDLLRTWPRGHAYLEDQLKRAVASILLNIVEVVDCAPSTGELIS